MVVLPTANALISPVSSMVATVGSELLTSKRPVPGACVVSS